MTLESVNICFYTIFFLIESPILILGGGGGSYGEPRKIGKLWSLFKLLGFEENKLYRYDYMNKSNLEESRF